MIPCRVLSPSDARPSIPDGSGLAALIPRGQHQADEFPAVPRLLEDLPRGSGTIMRIPLAGGWQ